MNTISYMGANLVAQQVNWSMTEGWDQGENAASAYYAPIETFRERFRAFIDLVLASGFDTLDVWNPQLEWQWATDEHFAIARELLDAARMNVASYAGYFGVTVKNFERATEVARALNTNILSGGTDLIHANRAGTLRILRERNLVLALENHLEKSPQDILDIIGDDIDVLGTAIDTGWWATQGLAPAETLKDLAPVLIHVHLKDILAVGEHTTCALGDGIADIPAFLEALAALNFDGPISIEHEPENFDPFEDVVLSRKRLNTWLGAL